MARSGRQRDHERRVRPRGDRRRADGVRVRARRRRQHVRQGPADRDARARARGFDIVRFNFLYKEKRSVAPTRCRAEGDDGGGRRACAARSSDPRRSSSAGARWAAARHRCSRPMASTATGLLLLAYPLHPAGPPGPASRRAPAAIRVPVLCVNGTRDALCTPALMDAAVSSGDRSVADALDRRRRP